MIPYWIEQEESRRRYLDDGYTTMVFYVSKERTSRLVRLKEIFLDFLYHKDFLLYMDHIDEYCIGDYAVTRKEICSDYLIKTKGEISFSLDLKEIGQRKGNLYSILPTTFDFPCDFSMNLPLQISSSRTIINNTYNKQLLKEVFLGSAFGEFLEELAAEGIEVYRLFDATKLISVIATDEFQKNQFKEKIKNLLLFKSENQWTSLSKGQLFPPIIYKYLTLDSKISMSKVITSDYYEEILDFARKLDVLPDKLDVVEFFKEHLDYQFKEFILNDLFDYAMGYKIASLPIFPYRLNGQLQFGSLEEGTWYYSEELIDSTMYYKVLDSSALAPIRVQKLLEVFGETYLQPFDTKQVIKALVSMMSTEEDYTKSWWTYAKMIYKFWDENLSMDLTSATERIANNKFLFDENYCPKECKEELLRLGIFEDVLNGKTVDCQFIKFLKELGVLHTFSDGTAINYHLYSKVFAKIQRLEFPVSADHELCRLAHTIIYDVLYKKSARVTRILANYRKAIVVKNVNGEYMSIINDLFYSTRPYEVREYRLEDYHIDESLYDKAFLELVGIPFDEVDDDFDMYDVDALEEEFYDWVNSYRDDTLSEEEEQIVTYLRNHPERIEKILKKVRD
ncbi:hypothetical protein P261_00023 [Lachnospiraceae bacterium TWA4]|nr:hypothetical protein P261_00023 [Lachnospiraceae bacterium TWA4]